MSELVSNLSDAEIDAISGGGYRAPSFSFLNTYNVAYQSNYQSVKVEDNYKTWVSVSQTNSITQSGASVSVTVS